MNYKIEGIDVLLNEDCILQRYYPLIKYKQILIENLIKNHHLTKNDCVNLSYKELMEMGLPDEATSKLFLLFLNMYEVDKTKLKEIYKLNVDENEIKAFNELYLLPGVKYTRAKLYYDAGYNNLNKIAVSTAEQIINDATKLIEENKLSIKPPLLKEVKTHIAVAKLYYMYKI